MAVAVIMSSWQRKCMSDLPAFFKQVQRLGPGRAGIEQMFGKTLSAELLVETLFRTPGQIDVAQFFRQGAV